ncbi:SET domain-containing protein 5 [Podospora conica]|nr:SET domain-containing protein 5 [Schizothecium conicum]
MWCLSAVFVACALVSTTVSAEHLSEWMPSQCARSPLLLQGHLACPSPWKVNRPRRPKPIPKSVRSNWKGKRYPSWDGPFDCVGKYCTYVNRHLNGGLVLISVESNIPIIDQFPVYPTSSPSASSSSGEAPFYAAQIPGKGIGLIARRTIRRNEIIMRNTPALLIQFGPHVDLPPAQRDDLYAKALRLLPAPRRREFMLQHGDDVYDKVDKNSFRLFFNGKQSFSGHIGVYPDISRFNHDCRPNVNYRIDNITHITTAVRDIRPGEELTVSYIDGHLPRHERQSRLRDWGFECTCPHCSFSPAEVAVSDMRMERIRVIEDELLAMVSGKEEADPDLGDELVRLYDEERFWTYIGPALGRAALVHALAGNEMETIEYARRAAEALTREKGAQHPETLSMRLLKERTREHWAWQKGKQGRGRG